MNAKGLGQHLSLPFDVQSDVDSLELISVWFSKGKAKVLTRSGTGLDERIKVWAEIVAAVVENIADHVALITNEKPVLIEQTLARLVTESIARKSV